MTYATDSFKAYSRNFRYVIHRVEEFFQCYNGVRCRSAGSDREVVFANVSKSIQNGQSYSVVLSSSVIQCTLHVNLV